MGATLKFTCPKSGCDYSTYFRLGAGEEDDSDAYQERLDVLSAEHPNHPAKAGNGE